MTAPRADPHETERNPIRFRPARRETFREKCSTMLHGGARVGGTPIKRNETPPDSRRRGVQHFTKSVARCCTGARRASAAPPRNGTKPHPIPTGAAGNIRSEETKYELQSLMRSSY